MQPTNAILNAMATLLAGDPNTLGETVGGVKIRLATNAFNPTPDNVIADFTEANFAGYAALLAALGPQQVFFDPTIGAKIIQMVEPLGGWNWVTTGAANLPQSIFGVFMTNNANTVVLGSYRFQAPYVLTGPGQGFNIPQMRFLLSTNALV